MENELKQERFKINNGRVLRRINLLRHTYSDLASVQKVTEHEGIRINEFMDCVNYLSEAGYIHLRSIVGHREEQLADAEYRELEAKVSAKGIRLLAGVLFDEAVEV